MCPGTVGIFPDLSRLTAFEAIFLNTLSCLLQYDHLPNRMKGAMEQSVRILILEDNQLDVQLMQRELQKARLSFLTVRVETLEEFTQQLELFLPDLILADYHLPTMTGEEALVVARRHDADLPFIFVTGTIGEELAIETLKKGATDYVMKENLKRLGPAVTRALHESNERKAHLRTELAYKDTMNRYREIVENASDIIFTMDYKGYFLHVNQAGLKSCGYSIGEMWKTKYLDLILPEHRNHVKRHYMRQFLSKEPVSYVEYPIQTKSGKVLWYAQHAVPVFDGETTVGFHVICRDITERKREDESIELRLSALKGLPTAIVAIDVKEDIIFLNKRAEALIHWKDEEVRGKNLMEMLVSKKDQGRVSELLQKTGPIQFEAKRKDGSIVTVSVEHSALLDANGIQKGYIGVWKAV